MADPSSHKNDTVLERKWSREYSLEQDQLDPLSSLRQQFHIPTRKDIGQTSFSTTTSDNNNDNDPATEPCIYLCGNSLGLQPKVTASYIDRFLKSWQKLGVYGHVEAVGDDGEGDNNNQEKKKPDLRLLPWMRAEQGPRPMMATLVGGKESEVEVMGTLTTNLHLLLSTFYQPTEGRYKIIIEEKAFPSDHYAALSHLGMRNFPAEGLITISPDDQGRHYFSTQHVINTISKHATTTALIVLPGVQFLTGQLFDIETITSFAHSVGIVIGWDLAHAVGNVQLKLHDWDVDFAVWCTYKYLNSGAGSVGGMFVHDRHGLPSLDQSGEEEEEEESDRQRKKSRSSSDLGLEKKYFGQSLYPHLSRSIGWWGANPLRSRFDMNTAYYGPIPGAAGWQISNPGALNIAALTGSLSVYGQVDEGKRLDRSERLTEYLIQLLDRNLLKYGVNWSDEADAECGYTIITPRHKAEHGAQVSIKLKPLKKGDSSVMNGRGGSADHLTDVVTKLRNGYGIVVDERNPDVVRVAPTPLYNSFADVWDFVWAFQSIVSAERECVS